MSSGLRIASAQDDASGLGISAKMKTLIDSFQVAGRNVNDGISLAQTAESALSESSTILGRMRELAVQASNGTLSTSDRTVLDNEYQELGNELDRISDSTEFNGVSLLDGSTSSVTLQEGVYEGDTVDVELTDSSSSSLGVDGTDLTSADSSSTAIDAIDDAIDQVSVSRASFGAAVNSLQSGLRTIQSARVNLADANSRIADLDYAAETAEFSKLTLIQSMGIGLQVHSNLSAGRTQNLLLGSI